MQGNGEIIILSRPPVKKDLALPRNILWNLEQREVSHRFRASVETRLFSKLKLKCGFETDQLDLSGELKSFLIDFQLGCRMGQNCSTIACGRATLAT